MTLLLHTNHNFLFIYNKLLFFESLRLQFITIFEFPSISASKLIKIGPTVQMEKRYKSKHLSRLVTGTFEQPKDLQTNSLLEYIIVKIRQADLTSTTLSPINTIPLGQTAYQFFRNCYNLNCDINKKLASCLP